MKRVIIEDQQEGLEKHLGERMTFFCVNYIYTGILAGVNETCILLQDAGIVYETGPLDTGTWRDCQALPHDWYIQIAAVESWGKLK